MKHIKAMESTELAIAILERLDVLMCIEDKQTRLKRAQEELTMILDRAIVEATAPIREQLAAARASELSWLSAYQEKVRRSDNTIAALTARLEDVGA